MSRWRKVWISALVLIVVALVVSVVILRQTYYNNLKPVSASQRAVTVTVPLGSSAKEIGSKLEAAGLIRASWAFEWYVRNNDLRDKLQAGTYAIRPNQSVQEVIITLTHGKVETDLVTILPGQRLDQIREALINNGGYTAEEVDKALDPAQYAGHPALVDKPKAASLEGYLYPDSYQKTADTKAAAIIRASLDEMQKHLTPEIRAAMTKHGLTVHEGIILASIVDQEVSNKSDKPTVAQVFLLRLKKGMQLGSDVTAFYGAIMAGQAPSVAYDSPYNTRIRGGMPPGPISNVSQAGLEAVANPANTDYIFFVAGDDGKTYFSHTNQEHESLTQQYCKKLCQ